MEFIANSKFDVKLYRRYPDDVEHEKDYGPGYLKLYAVPGDHSKDDGDDHGHNGNKTGVQVVFRTNGTMKVRANHILRPTSIIAQPPENENSTDIMPSQPKNQDTTVPTTTITRDDYDGNNGTNDDKNTDQQRHGTSHGR